MKLREYFLMVFLIIIVHYSDGQTIIDVSKDSTLIKRYLNGPTFHRNQHADFYASFIYKRKIDSLLQVGISMPIVYGLKYNPFMNESRPPFYGKRGLPYYMSPNRYDYLYKAKIRSRAE